MQLHADARRGNIEGVRRGLARGLSVNLFDREGDSGMTPLMAALASMNSPAPVKAGIGMIRFLLEAGANPNLGNESSSPVRLAVACADIATLGLLESSGTNLRKMSASGYGVFVTAAYRVIRGERDAGLRMMDHLLSRGISPDTATDYGESPLSVCWHHGEVAAVSWLLEHGANPAPLLWGPAHHAVWRAASSGETTGLTASEETDLWGRTPFHLATALDSPELMEALVNLGANPDTPIRGGASYESHALHVAAICDAAKAVRWLLEHGASPEVGGFKNETPLLTAVGSGKVTVVGTLLESGASPDAKGEFSEGIFHLTGNAAMFRALREFATPERLNAVDDCGEFPLATAAFAGDFEWVREMSDTGASPNFCGTGRTALHAAVESDALEIARLLLERGANPDAADVDGDRPMFRARSREMVALLLEFGANPCAENDVGEPAWSYIDDPWVRAFAQPA